MVLFHFSHSPASGEEVEALRTRAAGELAGRLKAEGLKFNLGHDPARRDRYVENARRWADR